MHIRFCGFYSSVNFLVASVMTSALEKDKISGVYIKYADAGENDLLTPILACDMLDFVSGNMDTNSLLKQKMTAENRKKVADAQSVTVSIKSDGFAFPGDSSLRSG